MAHSPKRVATDVERAIEGATRAATKVPTPFEAEQVNSLPVQVALVVPSTRDGENIARGYFENRIDFTRKWFSSHFGGDTTVRASGGYIGADGKLVEEAVALVESSTTIKSYNDHLDDFRRFIKRRRRNWGQEQIAYQIEGRFFAYPQRPFMADDTAVPQELVGVQ